MLQLQINARDKPDRDPQQTHHEPNVIRMEKFFQPNRKDLRRFTTIISNQQPIRVSRLQPGESNAQYDPDSQQKLLKKFITKRPLTQSSYQRSTGRLPSADMVRAPSRAGNLREFQQVIQHPASNNKSSEKLNTLQSDGKIVPGGHFYVDLPGLEGFESPQVVNDTNNNKNQSKRSSISDSATKGGRINYSTSVSSHNTHQESGHIDDDKRISWNIQEKRQSRDEISRENSLYNKQFKTIEKLQGAKYKAQQINEQVIKQTQFIKNDEEEEANFKELCDALNSHW